MATVHEKVSNWLYSVLTSEYVDVNRTYADAAEAISHYPALSPRTEVYTYENGTSSLLLLLSGTLPVTYRGTTYRFPVAVWIPHQYPRESPIVYVTPSQDMVVRPGQHVSSDGKVYHPYLAQWGRYWDKSSIGDFLTVLRGVFAKEPPVISKQVPQQVPRREESNAPPPVPPPPEEWRQPVQDSPMLSDGRAPAPPPKPPKSHESLQTDLPRTAGHQYTGGPMPPPLPPLPGKPVELGPRGHVQRYEHAAPAPVPQNYQPPNIGAKPTQQPPQHYYQPTPPPLLRPQQHELESPISPMTPISQNQPPYSRFQQAAPPPHFPSQSTLQQGRGLPPQPHPLSQQLPFRPPVVQTQPQPKQPVPNLLDSPLDVTLPSQQGLPNVPPPPIPPNPEKDALLGAISTTLVSQLRKTVSDNSAAIVPLQSQQYALQQAYAQLQAELDQLQQLDAALASNEKIIREAMVEADRVMDEARTRKVPEVDDVLVVPTMVGGQLYTLCAEEMACADALFVLGRALDKGRMGADVFVKQTRALARERFMKKALMKKIAKGMGLDEHDYR